VEFFKATQIDFMGHRRIAAVFSALMMMACVISMMVYPIPMGLDFTGGAQFELAFKQSVNAESLRMDIEKIPALKDAVVQNIGSSKQLMIRAYVQDNETVKQIKSDLKSIIPDVTITKAVFIGPQVGDSMYQSGIMALLMASLLTLVYIALRFEWRFAVSAILALIHDPILILGVFSFWHIEFDLIGLAALLTVFGYSLNDTIVVYDRVRENFRKYQEIDVRSCMNLSINQTLSRTIMTSGLTLAVVLALFIWGGDSLFAFSLSLIIGILVGTYSSIYVAGAFSMMIGLERNHLISQRKKATGPVV
jgi:preprotein translocase subunit SecF